MADGNLPERKSASIRRTALYRHFDSDGKLLYVGISLNPTYRLSQHREASLWFMRIARVDIEWLATREDAMKAEQAAIKAEKPLYNVMHTKPAKEMRELATIENSMAEVTRHVTRFNTCYSVKDAAEILGVSKHRIANAIVAGEISYYDNGEKILVSGWSVITYMEALQDGVCKVHDPLISECGERIYLSEQRLLEHIRNVRPSP